jgi:hypothetical protein
MAYATEVFARDAELLTLQGHLEKLTEEEKIKLREAD